MRPMQRCDDAAIKRYEDLLANVQEEQPDDTFLTKMLKDTIGDLKER